PEEDIVCCLPDSGDAQCDETDAADCAANGGINLGAGVCEPNPCASTSPNVVQCCVPQEGDQGEDDGGGPDCEELTADNCTAAGGTAMGTGSCEPDPCVPSSTTTTGFR